MKAMILAAGHGLRLRPVTDATPKCMVTVRGRPILEWTIEWLVSSKVSDIVINVSHLGQVVMDYFGDGRKLGARITYSVEDQPLGTAGGVKKVEWFFEEPFLVWYGDNLSRCNLARLERCHYEKGGVATICLHRREDPTGSGIVALDERNRVVRFLEKPAIDEVFSRWVNAGIYVLDPSVFPYISDEGTPDFGRDVFPTLLKRGELVFGYRLSSEEGLSWIDRPEDLARLRSKERA